MSNDRKHGKGIANSGFTLIEVIVAMAVLAVVATSILSLFSQSAKFNANARMEQKATLANQTVIEDIMTYEDLTAMAKGYESESGWAVVDSADPVSCATVSSIETSPTSIITPAGGLVNGNAAPYYFKRPVVIDGTEFLAMVTVDPTVYATTASGRGSKKAAASDNKASSLLTDIYYNDLAMPELRSIYTDTNVVVVQSDEDDKGINQLAGLYGGDTNVATTAIRGQIPSGDAWREMNVILQYATKESGGVTTIDADFVEARVEFVYYGQDSAGNPIHTTIDVMEDEFAIEDLKNIYIFYKNFCTDYDGIDIHKKDTITLKLNEAIAASSTVDQLRNALQRQLSFYLIFTRNGLTDDQYANQYQPKFVLQDPLYATMIANDPSDPGKAMVVSNAMNGVEMDAILQQSGRDTVADRKYQKADGSQDTASNAHTGILVAQNQTLVADVKVQIFDKSGETEYQVSDTGKGE